MITSSAWSPKRLYPARCSAASRWAASGRRWPGHCGFRNGSMMVPIWHGFLLWLHKSLPAVSCGEPPPRTQLGPPNDPSLRCPHNRPPHTLHWGVRSSSAQPLNRWMTATCALGDEPRTRPFGKFEGRLRRPLIQEVWRPACELTRASAAEGPHLQSGAEPQARLDRILIRSKSIP